MGKGRNPCHIVHDVKFHGRLKSRLVAGGHRSPRVCPEDCHASVVSMEAVRMGFLMAKLNNLQVCAGDIGNAHLNAKTNEKLCIIAGPEFGPGCAGKRLIVDKALCGTQNGGNQFHALTTAHFAKLDFHPSQAHPDLHIKKCSDGHCECIARHVDNVIVFSKDPMAIMQKLTNTFTTRGVGKPRCHLGGDTLDLDEQWEKEGITQAFSAEAHISNLFPKMAKMLEIEQFHKCNTPMDSNCHPELDTN